MCLTFVLIFFLIITLIITLTLTLTLIGYEPKPDHTPTAGPNLSTSTMIAVDLLMFFACIRNGIGLRVD